MSSDIKKYLKQWLNKLAPQVMGSSWLKWSIKNTGRTLYKTTGRNINIALPPNLAVDKSYNINDIVFLIVVALVKALGKLISYFDSNCLNSIKNIIGFSITF